jgi:hypothetical protein
MTELIVGELSGRTGALMAVDELRVGNNAFCGACRGGFGHRGGRG